MTKRFLKIIILFRIYNNNCVFSCAAKTVCWPEHSNMTKFFEWYHNIANESSSCCHQHLSKVRRIYFSHHLHRHGVLSNVSVKFFPAFSATSKRNKYQYRSYFIMVWDMNRSGVAIFGINWRNRSSCHHQLT